MPYGGTVNVYESFLFTHSLHILAIFKLFTWPELNEAPQLANLSPPIASGAVANERQSRSSCSLDLSLKHLPVCQSGMGEFLHPPFFLCQFTRFKGLYSPPASLWITGALTASASQTWGGRSAGDGGKALPLPEGQRRLPSGFRGQDPPQPKPTQRVTQG